MKKVLFIGSRLNALEAIPEFKDLQLVGIYAQKDSLLDEKLEKDKMFSDINVRKFDISDKAKVLEEIEAASFDLLISNGCPLILPVSRLKKPHQLFINIHPTLLPDLKGKTPLNGVFMTHATKIGATMHHMDDGIDTGMIIAQASADVTPDLDQGLVYRIAFGLETVAFKAGMKLLTDSEYLYQGSAQEGKGSYFNRTEDLQTINIEHDPTGLIIDKIKSFGVKGQGSTLALENSTLTIYSGERIINKYLLGLYSDAKPGDIVLMYDDKLLVKTIDGLVKITNYETKSQL